MAGGFMSGFGKAFSDSFAQASDQRFKKDETQFEYMYKNYLDRQEETKKLDVENSKNIKRAKALATTYGKNEALWPAVYDMSELDDSAIIKFLTENEGQISPEDAATSDGSGAADSSANLGDSAKSSVDAQMSESGMTPPAEGAPSIFSKTSSRTERDTNKAYDKISQVTGDDSETVKKTMTGEGVDGGKVPGMPGFKVTWQKKPKVEDAPNPWDITSSEKAITYQHWAHEKGTEADQKRADQMYHEQLNLELIKARKQAEANAEAQGTKYTPKGAVLRDDNGNFVRTLTSATDGQGREYWLDPTTGKEAEGKVQPYSKDMEKDLDGMADTMGKQGEDYTMGLENLKQTARLSQELITLSGQMGGVPMDISGNVAQLIDKVSRNFTNVVTLLTQEDLAKDGVLDVTPGRISQIDAVEKELEEKLSTPLDNASHAAVIAALIDTKATKLAYMFAASMGQSGRSVTNEEFTNFKNTIMGGGKPEALQKILGSNMNDMYNMLKDKEISLNEQSIPVRRFEQKWKMPSPFKPGQPVDEALSEDENTKRAFEDITMHPVNLGGLPDEKIDPDMPKGLSPDEVANWKYASPRLKELLKKKYGGGK